MVKSYTISYIFRKSALFSEMQPKKLVFHGSVKSQWHSGDVYEIWDVLMQMNYLDGSVNIAKHFIITNINMWPEHVTSTYTDIQPITRWQILDSSKLKKFADDNSIFDENGRKLSKWVENTGKRRNCSLRAISPFPTVFSKGLFPRGVKRCHCVGMG